MNSQLAGYNVSKGCTTGTGKTANPPSHGLFHWVILCQPPCGSLWVQESSSPCAWLDPWCSQLLQHVGVSKHTYPTCFPPQPLPERCEIAISWGKEGAEQWDERGRWRENPLGAVGSLLQRSCWLWVYALLFHHPLLVLHSPKLYELMHVLSTFLLWSIKNNKETQLKTCLRSLTISPEKKDMLINISRPNTPQHAELWQCWGWWVRVQAGSSIFLQPLL